MQGENFALELHAGDSQREKPGRYRPLETGASPVLPLQFTLPERNQLDRAAAEQIGGARSFWRPIMWGLLQSEVEEKIATCEADTATKLLRKVLDCSERRGIGPTDYEFWVLPDSVYDEIERALRHE